MSPETHTEFMPGVAYVHARAGSSVAGSVVVDLADPSQLEPEDGPRGDFRVLPWSDGQHLRVDRSQIHLLSGLRELEQYPQGPEPSLVVYTVPERGWLLDVQGTKSYKQTLRFQRLTKPDAPQTMGSIGVRANTILPPLIEDDVILNANTFGPLGGAGGG
ncbi:MAG: hypothetical protein ABI895_37385 [Deltaproteobacteria bacterium]